MTFCALCGRQLLDGDHLADHHVFRDGELQYVELAHEECAEADNMIREEPYWETL